MNFLFRFLKNNYKCFVLYELYMKKDVPVVSGSFMVAVNVYIVVALNGNLLVVASGNIMIAVNGKIRVALKVNLVKAVNEKFR